MVNNDKSFMRNIASFMHLGKSNADKRDSVDQIEQDNKNHRSTPLSENKETKQRSNKGNASLSVIPLGSTCDENSIIPVPIKSVVVNESKSPQQKDTRIENINPRQKSIKMSRTSIKGKVINFNVGMGADNSKDNMSTVVCSPKQIRQNQSLTRTTGLEKKGSDRSCPKKQNDNLSTIVCSPKQLKTNANHSKPKSLKVTTSTDEGDDIQVLSKEASIGNVVGAIRVPKCIEDRIVQLNPFNFDEEKGDQVKNLNNLKGTDEFVTNATEAGSDMACSPKHREDTIIPLSSPNYSSQNQAADDEETPKTCCSNMSKEVLKKGVKKHTGLFPFGPLKTLFPIVFSFVALICSIVCKESTSFVTLEKPLHIDSQHLPVTELGLFFMKVCETDELVNIDAALGLYTVIKVEYSEGSQYIINDYIQSEVSDQAELGSILSFEAETSKCRKYKLRSPFVQDRLWNIARCLVGFTASIGCLFTIATSTTVFWNSINLIVVSAGIFVTYLCQSFAFLFYDSTICKKHICHRSTGTTVAIVASFFWFFAGISVMWLYICDRSEKQKERIMSMRARSAPKKELEKRQHEFMMIQWSILDFFRKRDNPGSDTDSAHSSVEASRVSI